MKSPRLLVRTVFAAGVTASLLVGGFVSTSAVAARSDAAAVKVATNRTKKPTPVPTVPTAPTVPTRTVVWADEFNGPAGAVPDPSKWGHEVGGHGWGNNELQTYTDRISNASTDGNGSLQITARQETSTGADGIQRDYTSARLFTKGKYEFTYGLVEARIKVADGQGTWSAFWMLGHDAWTNGWPESGEIDVMEALNDTRSVHTTTHGPSSNSAGRYFIGQEHVSSTVPYSNDYHVYAVNWQPNLVEFMIDGKVVHTVTPDKVPAGGRWVHDKPNYLLLNVAVGGWAGAPDASTDFPRIMLVDWVRISK